MGDMASRLPEAAGGAALYVGFGFMDAGMLVKAASRQTCRTARNGVKIATASGAKSPTSIAV
jgi:hypothetical protein